MFFHQKGGLPAFWCYSLLLVDTQMLVDSWGKCVSMNIFPPIFVLSLFPFVMEKDRKTCLIAEK